MGLLQVLYVNRERAPGFPASRLAEALEFDCSEVEKCLGEMVSSGVVDRVDEGYRISEKGYFMVFKRETSNCPYL